MFGRKRMLLLGARRLRGLVGLCCASAWSPEALIAARALQGLAAALLIPQCVRADPRHLRAGNRSARRSRRSGRRSACRPCSARWSPAAHQARPVRDRLARAVPHQRAGRRCSRWSSGAKVLPSVTPGAPGSRLDGRRHACSWPRSASWWCSRWSRAGRSAGRLWLFGVLASRGARCSRCSPRQQRRRVRAGRTPLVELSVLRKRSYVSGVVFTLVFFGSHRRVLADHRAVPAARAGPVPR